MFTASGFKFEFPTTASKMIIDKYPSWLMILIPSILFFLLLYVYYDLYIALFCLFLVASLFYQTRWHAGTSSRVKLCISNRVTGRLNLYIDIAGLSLAYAIHKSNSFPAN
jgi:hypothetical protein